MLSNKEILKYFHYFVSVYFNQSESYSDLPRLIRRYRESEVQETVDGLLRELILLQESEDWEYIQQFVEKHGERSLSIDRIKKMIEILLEGLQ